MGWIFIIIAIAAGWYFDISPIHGKETVYTRVCYEDECQTVSDFIYLKTVYRASFENQIVASKVGTMPADRLTDCAVIDSENWACSDRYMNDGNLVYRQFKFEYKGLPIPEIITKYQWINEFY